MLPAEKNTPVVDPTRLRVIVFGPPKIGKSTFAACNDKALFLDTDNNGTAFLSCWRTSIGDWMSLKTTLAEAAKDDRFDTIVIDTVDRAHQMCRDFICKQNSVQHESEDKAFGRVWDMVRAEFTRMLSFIQTSNKGLWLLSHSVTKEIKVGNQKKSVTTLSMGDKPGRLVAAMADVIIYIDADEGGKRKLFLKAEDSLECGDRTKHLTEDIEFSTEQEAYDKFIGCFKEKKA